MGWATAPTVTGIRPRPIATYPGDTELQEEPLGHGRNQRPETKSDEPEAAGYGDTSTQMWKLYGTESEKYDKALVDSWMGNTDSMLIFTGLFSSIVASFLIQTSQNLLPDSGAQTVSLLTQLVAQSDGTTTPSPQSVVQQGATSSAIRVNILMFLSLFFSVTSALVSTLIRQWAREYLQYSQPIAAPHKRGRVRAYLFDGLSHFQMRRLTYGVPVLLHLAVFLFFFALSEWLYSISVPVGATARYCLAALLVVYIALSISPLIAKNAPYQTALTTPLQACASFIKLSFIALLRLVRRSSEAYGAQKGPGLFSNIHVNRARALIEEIKKRSSKLDRFAMQWLLQYLDDDDMDTFLSGLPGYIHSPLTDAKLVVEGLKEDGVPGRIREHFTTCVISVELSQEESMSRASACISSLRLISEAAANTAVRRPGSENDDIKAILRYLEPLCYISNSVTALRASCIRGLVIREFLFPLAPLDVAELLTTKFPDYLKPLYRVIRVWKTTEIDQWSRASQDPSYRLPSDQEMWASVVCDGPLINLAVLSYAILSRSGQAEVNLDMAWKTLKSLLKALSLAQVRASTLARARFKQVIREAQASVSGGRAQVTPLLEALGTVISGLHLATAFAYAPNPKLPPTQIEAIFGQEQLRDSELLEAFAVHLPRFVHASGPEMSTSFMEHLIVENKLWEQLHFSLLKCFQPQVPFPDKLRIIVAFFNIFDVAFLLLTDSPKIDWQAPVLDLLIGHVDEFGMRVAPGMFIEDVANFCAVITHVQLCHALLVQFSRQHSRGEPLVTRALNGLRLLSVVLGLGTKEDREDLTAKNNPDLVTKAGAILDVTLRDGPLSNFCKIGRLIFEVMLNKRSNLSSEDIKRPWALLRRMLDTPHFPLVNASEQIWAKFDHLRTVVQDAITLEGTGQNENAKKLQPLLEMIEEVNRMRTAADDLPEGTGRDDNRTSTSTGAQSAVVHRPSGAPIPGSSRGAKASRPEPGSSMNLVLWSPTLSHITTPWAQTSPQTL